MYLRVIYYTVQLLKYKFSPVYPRNNMNANESKVSDHANIFKVMPHFLDNVKITII